MRGRTLCHRQIGALIAALDSTAYVSDTRLGGLGPGDAERRTICPPIAASAPEPLVNPARRDPLAIPKAIPMATTAIAAVTTQ